MQQTIRDVKENRTMERGYMAWIDIRDEIRDETAVESKQEAVLELLCELGKMPENVEALVMSENRIDVLRTMLKIAAKATSFSDFQEKITNL